MRRLIIKILILSNLFLFFTFQLLASSIWELKTNGLYKENSNSLSITSRNDTLFLLDYPDIFFSTDYGDNWYVHCSCLKYVNTTDSPSYLETLDHSMLVFSIFNEAFRIDNSKQCNEISFDPNQKKLKYMYRSLAKIKNYTFVALSGPKSSVYRSSNDGSSWETTSFPYSLNYIPIGFAANDSCLFISDITERKMWRSCDYGTSWIVIDFPGVWFPSSLVTDKNIIYAYADNNDNIFYSSSNNGDSWVSILQRQSSGSSNPFMSLDVKDDFIFIPNLYIFWGASGIVNVTYCFSSDGGKNWYNANFPEIKTIVYQSYIYKDYIFIIVEDINKSNIRKLYRTKKSDLINYATAIEESSEPQLSVYPNPTREFITIPVESVKIGSIYKIIDILGRVVTEGELSNQHIDVSHLPSGLYNIVFISENQTFYQKFIKN